MLACGLTSLLNALAAGWIFIILAVTGARGKLIQMVPRSIMLATSAGIGLFLAFIGLQSSEGLGLVRALLAWMLLPGSVTSLCPSCERMGSTQYDRSMLRAEHVCACNEQHWISHVV